MIVGCYSLHLYCDFGDAEIHEGMTFPHEFTGRTEAACFRDAKKRGWRIYSQQRKAKCPRCVKSAATSTTAKK